MSDEYNLLIDFESLPFHIGTRSSPSNVTLPDILPFRAGIRTDCDLLIQLHNRSVSHFVDEAYKMGSIIGTPMSESGIGRNYAEDFLKFILQHAANMQKERIRILEIGCGTGYLLSLLKNLGFDVVGIEAGRQGQDGSRTYGVEIIQDFFPISRDRLKRTKYDILIHYGVLEHVQNPVSFLREQKVYLSKTGLIIFSVPNCREYIIAGDISMFLHEHWNYFNLYSLKKVVEKAGLQLLRLENAGYGGSIYAVAAKSGKSIDVPEDLNWSLKFEDGVKQHLENMKRFFQECLDTECSVGIFCPARATNMLHLIQPGNTFRFFDDDKLLHGRFYPPFDVPVESRETLIKRPVNQLLIMSSTFGGEIRKSLLNELRLKNTKIVLFSELTSVASASN